MALRPVPSRCTRDQGSLSRMKITGHPVPRPVGRDGTHQARSTRGTGTVCQQFSIPMALTVLYCLVGPSQHFCFRSSSVLGLSRHRSTNGTDLSRSTGPGCPVQRDGTSRTFLTGPTALVPYTTGRDETLSRPVPLNSESPGPVPFDYHSPGPVPSRSNLKLASPVPFKAQLLCPIPSRSDLKLAVSSR